MVSLLLLFNVLSALFVRVSGSPSYIGPRKYADADGELVELCQRGDEHDNYLCTCTEKERRRGGEDNLFAARSQRDDDGGYTVLLHNGRYVFADQSADGNIYPTEFQVGKADPKKLGIKKSVRPAKKFLPEDFLRKRSPRQLRNLLRKRLKPGNRKLWFDLDDWAVPTCINEGDSSNPCYLQHLVVMVRFSDHKTTRNLTTNADYDELYNADAHGSVKDYFEKQSYGALIVNTTVVGWIDLDANYTEDSAVSTNKGLNLPDTRETWRHAMEKLENAGLVNFADFDSDSDGFIDALTMLHSGTYSLYGRYCRMHTAWHPHNLL